MSHKILGFLNNDHSLTSSALSTASAELFKGAREEDAWGGLGIGWVQDGRALERKNPRITNGALDPIGLLSDVPSRVVLGLATSEIGATSTSLPPHRFRTMLYADGGCSAAADELADELIDALPDFLQRNVPGRVASAARFYNLLDALFDADAFHAASQRRAQAARAIAAGLSALSARCEDGMRGYTGMLATERLLVAASIGEPLYYRAWNGIEVPAGKPLFAGHRTRPTEHPHYRALLVANGPTPDGEHWEELAPDHVLWVDDGWAVKTHPIFG